MRLVLWRNNFLEPRHRTQRVTQPSPLSVLSRGSCGAATDTWEVVCVLITSTDESVLFSGRVNKKKTPREVWMNNAYFADLGRLLFNTPTLTLALCT